MSAKKQPKLAHRTTWPGVVDFCWAADSQSRPVYGQPLKSTRLQWLFIADKKDFSWPSQVRRGSRPTELGRFCQSFESAAQKLFLQVDWLLVDLPDCASALCDWVTLGDFCRLQCLWNLLRISLSVALLAQQLLAVAMLVAVLLPLKHLKHVANVP